MYLGQLPTVCSARRCRVPSAARRVAVALTRLRRRVAMSRPRPPTELPGTKCAGSAFRGGGVPKDVSRGESSGRRLAADRSQSASGKTVHMRHGMMQGTCRQLGSGGDGQVVGAVAGDEARGARQHAGPHPALLVPGADVQQVLHGGGVVVLLMLGALRWCVSRFMRECAWGRGVGCVAWGPHMRHETGAPAEGW